jgi:glycosyltransferase involved in cell wall biosynthesis
VEWENARQAGAERATRTLRELVSQTAELAGEIDGRPELIVLYEKNEVPHEVVEAAVRKACGSDAPFDVRFHATEGSNYYDQKNQGAHLASREYLLFLDSDVIPEEGWLRALLGSLRPGVEVVAGSTYVETTSFFGRAFGLFWFYPLRTPSNGLQQANFFYANNVIFKRALFLAYKYPDLPLYRGHCAFLGTRLRHNGIRLFLQRGARVRHPPPTPKHFVHRALSEGYDFVARARIAGRESAVTDAELRIQIANVRKRVNKRLEHIKVGRAEAAMALALGTTYCLLRFAGQRWALRSPESAQRALGIPSGVLPAPMGKKELGRETVDVR